MLKAPGGIWASSIKTPLKKKYKIRKLSLESYKHSKDLKKVIKEDELENYINEGWGVQTVLLNGRILIRRIN
ncbi:MAG: hypothetical protein QXL46_03995, partial [Nitrososphaerales archaeon]